MHSNDWRRKMERWDPWSRSQSLQPPVAMRPCSTGGREVPGTSTLHNPARAPSSLHAGRERCWPARCSRTAVSYSKFRWPRFEFTGCGVKKVHRVQGRTWDAQAGAFTAMVRVVVHVVIQVTLVG